MFLFHWPNRWLSDKEEEKERAENALFLLNFHITVASKHKPNEYLNCSPTPIMSSQKNISAFKMQAVERRIYLLVMGDRPWTVLVWLFYFDRTFPRRGGNRFLLYHYFVECMTISFLPSFSFSPQLPAVLKLQLTCSSRRHLYLCGVQAKHCKIDSVIELPSFSPWCAWICLEFCLCTWRIIVYCKRAILCSISLTPQFRQAEFEHYGGAVWTEYSSMILMILWIQLYDSMNQMNHGS